MESKHTFFVVGLKQIQGKTFEIQWTPLNMAISIQAKNGNNNRRPALAVVFI